MSLDLLCFYVFVVFLRLYGVYVMDIKVFYVCLL